MLVNLHHGDAAEHRRLLVAGVLFLALIGGLVGLSVAVYTKVFEPVTMVTVQAERAGLQLPKFGDVRINGVLVGQVRDVSQDGRQASIRIGLRPAAAREIPSNITVEILPTTLFGQKYVSLVRPDIPSGTPLRDGDVISSDRVRTNVELSRILADLFPLLRSVRPADLNATLHALATALGGRGEEIGQTMEKLESYLGVIGDDLPTLRQDLVLLADVAETYDLAAPDLMEVLANVTVTSRTIISREDQLGVFFDDLAGLAGTSTRILADNEAGMIRVGEVTAPITRLLATYSPQFPCLLKGLDTYDPLLSKAFQGDRIRQYVELGAPQYDAYTEKDRPTYGEVGHGPWCAGLPDPQVPSAGFALDQGSDIDENPPTSPLPDFRTPAGFSNVTSGYAGSEAEQSVVNALLAARSGRPVDSYGSLPGLMYAPMLRGEEVTG